MSQAAVEPLRTLPEGQRHPGSGLFRNTLVFASISFVAYLFSLGKTIIVSRFFGTSPEMDAFNISILVPNLLGALVIGSASASLVPGLARAGESSTNHRSSVYRSSFTLFVG